MIRSLLSVGLFLALAIPAVAGPPATNGSAPANLPSATPLFYEIRAVPGERVQLDFEVRVNGALHLRERLAVTQPEEKGIAAVEILAYHPAERARLAKLAAEPGKKLRIRVSVDGVKKEELAFEHLVAANQTLRETGFRPVATERPSVSGPGVLPSRQPDPAFLSKQTEQECREGCYQSHDQCTSNCVWIPSVNKTNKYVSCDACNSELNSCLAGCEPYVCQPTSSEQVYSEYLYDQFTGWQDCLNDIYWYGEQILYDRYERWYRFTRYRVTRNCDGTTSTEVLAVWYSYENCHRRGFWGCYDQWVWWGPSCNVY
jgi:hypothetical protein